MFMTTRRPPEEATTDRQSTAAGNCDPAASDRDTRGTPDSDGARGISRRRALTVGGAALGGAGLAGVASAQRHGTNDGADDSSDDGSDGGTDASARRYRVTVTDLTCGQPFTPPAVAAHRPEVEVFSVGEPANEATQQVAENGNLGPLTDLLQSTPAVRGAAVGDAPLVPKGDPGDTGNPYYATLSLSADASATHLTFLGMLVATNDGIVGLDTVPLPEAVNESRTYYANGYDVGTEQNTERFADMVPPAQSLILGRDAEGGTTESDPALAEDDVIRPHRGIRGVGDMDPAVYDWDEPAAALQVERLE